MAQIERALHLRFVRGRAAALHHALPVNLREKGVPHDLLRIDQPLSRIFDQQAGKQVPRNLIVMLSELKLLLANV